MKRNEIPIDDIREWISYDPLTGEFRWKKDRSNMKAGELAGNDAGDGYRRVLFKGKSYQLHRIAFALMTGNQPPPQTDHINGNRLDNRWANLREATPQQNQMNKGTQKNNKTGVHGVYFRRGRYISQLKVDRKIVHTSSHLTLDEAAIARRNAEIKYFGEFSREGSFNAQS